ncbi:beta-propeller domain-containing protein [Brevundimonas lenta]|uniref:Uncharacterized protein n=1 Tax=Brevundimonas lenta TaxID=424796 RepID=A0A7W6JC92_9CAUL|nr:beta-propeller domain-containing protein [Brevundimonas lenta]MBB4082387.1 hypothetical protein [Brevundimonas lenta]
MIRTLAKVSVIMATAVLTAILATPALAQSAQPGLTPFASDEALVAFIEERAEAPAAFGAGCTADEEPACVEEIVVTGSRIVPSITNTQEAGVDEGGIVKRWGDYLVVLRRGKLFTVSVADRSLRPVDAIDAFAPGVDASDDWYDEMLIAGDRVIVLGYSYGRGGTEINRFRLSPDGQLTFEDAYHLRSNDYYSSRNYAARLIGDQLIVYTPLTLNYGDDALRSLPSLRRWTGDEKAPFRRIVSASDVYVSPHLRDTGAPVEALHTVIRCDLAAAAMDCHATGVLGPESRNFYVSSEAVYLWTSEEGWPVYGEEETDRDPHASLYRIPLDGRRPQAIRTRGAPLDQFSFREDADAGVLNVVVWSEGYGDAMWNAEFTDGAAALLRLPFDRFGDGTRQALARDYRLLPALPNHSIDLINRFVGDHVLIAGTQFAGSDEDGVLVISRIAVDDVRVFNLQEPVGRIEQIGADALVVGSDDAVAFTTIELSRGPPRLGSRYVLPGAEETETRSHGFFFRADNRDGATGLMGLPVMRDLGNGRTDQFYQTADMLFLRRQNRALSPLGTLESAPGQAANDGCTASCLDWYGDSRPIFMDGRIFALLGYELVEGQEADGQIREVARVDFAPGVAGAHKD